MSSFNIKKTTNTGGGEGVDPYLDFSRGLFSNITCVNKFGRNPDIDTATKVNRIRHFYSLFGGSTSTFFQEFRPYKIFNEKTDIIVRCEEVSANNADLSAGFDLILVDN
tara:strand:- start:1107 stop:1433 length:327 start_codon:yes stop_codon:yes gene_type:complete